MKTYKSGYSISDPRWMEAISKAVQCLRACKQAHWQHALHQYNLAIVRKPRWLEGKAGRSVATWAAPSQTIRLDGACCQHGLGIRINQQASHKGTSYGWINRAVSRPVISFLILPWNLLKLPGCESVTSFCGLDRVQSPQSAPRKGQANVTRILKHEAPDKS